MRKKSKEQPGLAGLLLIVTGMLLISVVFLTITGSAALTGTRAKVTAGMTCAAVASLGIGAVLSGRKSK
ncbi:MAG: hypothetical protein U1G07_17605 [Verrucomicrobiota bacterium]